MRVLSVVQSFHHWRSVHHPEKSAFVFKELSAPPYMKYGCWRMLIWKGWKGFFLSILRKLSTMDVHWDCFPDRKCSQLSTVYSSLQQAGWINLLALERQTGAMMEDTVDSGSRCVCVWSETQRDGLLSYILLVRWRYDPTTDRIQFSYSQKSNGFWNWFFLVFQ